MLKYLFFSSLNHQTRSRLNAKWAQVSAISSIHDAPGKPDERLLTVISPLAEAARNATLPLLQDRSVPPDVFDWPGEHYKLLEALIKVLACRNVIEIGTFSGLSSLAILGALPPSGTLATFDIIPWNQIAGTHLRQTDFDPTRFVQRVCDLKDHKSFQLHRKLFEEADLIFIDGPKDGAFERAILSALASLRRPKPFFVLLDDIRIWKMLPIWRGLTHPKLDLTSLAHYTGTGLVHWIP